MLTLDEVKKLADGPRQGPQGQFSAPAPGRGGALVPGPSLNERRSGYTIERVSDVPHSTLYHTTIRRGGVECAYVRQRADMPGDGSTVWTTVRVA